MLSLYLYYFMLYYYIFFLLFLFLLSLQPFYFCIKQQPTFYSSIKLLTIDLSPPRDHDNVSFSGIWKGTFTYTVCTLVAQNKKNPHLFRTYFSILISLLLNISDKYFHFYSICFGLGCGTALYRPFCCK